MTKLDITTLNNYLANGLLRCQKHNSHPLLIWNYSEKVQFDDLWDEITLMCRGLVTDNDGNIVARAFPKFFNIEQNRHKESESFEIYEKLDGSLGILFHYADEWHLATRGSFHSEQAIRGAQILKKYSLENLSPEATYLFEIIYPENRIVVDYQGLEELIMIGTFSKSGNELQTVGHNFPEVKKHDFKDWKEIQKLNWKNSEGFIIRFCNGSRCKVKFEDYVRLHRILSNVSQKSVWELICERKSLEEYLALIPDEFQAGVKKWHADLSQKYVDIKSKVAMDFVEAKLRLGSEFSRKDFAISIKDHPYKSMLFSSLDNKDIHDHICGLIKPTASQPLIFDKE